jgi:hypothetical protein
VRIGQHAVHVMAERCAGNQHITHWLAFHARPLGKCDGTALAYRARKHAGPTRMSSSIRRAAAAVDVIFSRNPTLRIRSSCMS